MVQDRPMAGYTPLNCSRIGGLEEGEVKLQEPAETFAGNTMQTSLHCLGPNLTSQDSLTVF